MKIALACLVLLFFTRCKEVYLPFNNSTSGKGIGVLVVEGYICSNGPTNVKLSRTTNLSERILIPEENASVVIESDNNAQYPVIENAKGEYSTDSLNLTSSARYRLKIKTSNNREYTSDYRTLIPTPAIDSLSWTKVKSDGVYIYVNVNAPGNPTEYYRWEYDETWEFNSKYRTNLQYTYDILPSGEKHYTGMTYYHQPERILDVIDHEIYDKSIFTCWKSQHSTSVVQATTKQLSVNKLITPVRHVEEDGWELSKLYSINVIQYGASKDAYDFFSVMKKNTESLGTTFDAQPSEIRGNIKCTSDSSELVIGFIEAGAVHQKRIFIDGSEFLDWYYNFPCRSPGKDTIITNDPYSILWYGVVQEQLPVSTQLSWVEQDYPFRIQKASFGDKYCVDCTLRGTNVKPSFWP